MDQRIFRFAPSPNGKLHLGHAFSALLNLKLAREAGGKMLLRIEDIDQTRCTPELEAQMLRDLEWIGFEWDERPRRQSEHFDIYHEALHKLENTGLLFPSTMTRGDIKKRVAEEEAGSTVWLRDPDGAPHYPGHEHTLDPQAQEMIRQSGQPYSERLDIAKAHIPENLAWLEHGQGLVKATPTNWGKPILARKDTPTSYHLCCVVDDALQNVTNIVRGRDLYHATSLHRLLQELLELPEPRYAHHQLLLDEGGGKLSKSRQDTSLSDLRNSGFTPSDIKEIFEKQGLIEDPFGNAHK